MMLNVTFKAMGSKYGAEAVKVVAKSATVVLTNPASLAAATVVSIGYMTYKHAENKDKRKYEYSK